MSIAAGTIPNDQSGKFNRRSVTSFGVAAGLNFAVPSLARWKVYHIRITLVTTATAGARLVLVQIRDVNNNVVFEIVNSGTYGAGRSVAAGTTERYELSIFTPPTAQAVTLRTTMAVPYIMTSGENILVKDTANIDTADAITVEAMVEEWIEP